MPAERQGDDDVRKHRHLEQEHEALPDALDQGRGLTEEEAAEDAESETDQDLGGERHGRMLTRADRRPTQRLWLSWITPPART
jgi:hypothetical protein